MTGYGRAEAAHGDWLVTIELSSVNRKQTDIAINLPGRLAAAEADVRKRIAAAVSRGRVNARITLDANGAAHATGAGSSKAKLSFDKDLAEQYLAAIDSITRDGDRPVEFRPVDLLRAPGVFSLEEETVETEEVLPDLLRVVDEALGALMKMQDTEGQHLRSDLLDRLDTIAASKAAIAERAPQVVVSHRENLLARLQNAGLEIEVDLEDERIVREIALFADRCDISEELTRIDSHLQQFSDYLAQDAEGAAPEPVGRPLDFLCQELNREFNTIGSKANDSVISKHVVALKTELEKVREQVQNVQ